jgi:hypothetical protein
MPAQNVPMLKNKWMDDRPKFSFAEVQMSDGEGSTVMIFFAKTQ